MDAYIHMDVIIIMCTLLHSIYINFTYDITTTIPYY